MMVNNLFFLSLILILSSCSVAYIAPSSKMVSSEVNGKKWKGSVEARVLGATKSTVSFSGGPQINNSLNNYRSITTGVAGNMGIWEKLDILFYSSARSTPMFGAKVQVIGDPRVKAKKGNFSMSVLLAGGAGSRDEYDENGVSSDNKVKATSTSSELSLISGYRVTDKTLIYLGVSHTTYNFKGDVTSGPDTGDHFDYDGSANGASLGIKYGKEIYVKLEASGQKLKWDNTPNSNLGYYGFALGAEW